MGECEFCGEFDCDIDHGVDDCYGDNTEDETGYSGDY